MLKYWRVWLLVIMVIGAVLAIGMKAYPYGRNGVEIVYVSENSPAFGELEQGMIITALNGQKIKNYDEWALKTENLTGKVSLTANGKKYIFDVNNSLGIDATDIERTNLDLGLDLRGGTRIILKPKENDTADTIDQIISTLQTRANLYGLREIGFYSIKSGENYYVQIEAAGIGGEVIENLLSKQGRFEAKVEKPIEISDSRGTLVLGESSYPVIVYNNSIEINNTVLYLNQTFNFRGMEFQYANKTGNKIILLATVYTGKDIEIVYSDPQRSGIRPLGNVYQFYFVISVSLEGAERFADVTAGIPRYVDIQTGEEYLDSKIYLYLDDKLVSDLRIGADLGGRVYQTPQITGTRQQKEDAVEEKLRLQTILRSGELPVKIETVSVDVISPRLGEGFFNSAFCAAGIAAVIVIIIVFVRYRSLKISIPLVLIGMSEVIIILGVASTGDSMIWAVILVLNFLLISTAWWKKHEIDIYAWVGAILIPLLGLMSWTIDLPAIGGMIAALGTSVDHQIIIADETMSGKEEKRAYTIKDKIKMAFFIIFGAAATTIAAMMPLMFLGIGLVRGFAITTVVGVLIGILITRPAYAKIVETLTGRE